MCVCVCVCGTEMYIRNICALESVPYSCDVAGHKN